MIILEHRITKEQMELPEGTPYNGWEWFAVGSTAATETTELEHELKKEGLLLGDLVAGVIHSTKLDELTGRTNCTSCRRRQEMLNEWHRRGKAFVTDLIDSVVK